MMSFISTEIDQSHVGGEDSVETFQCEYAGKRNRPLPPYLRCKGALDRILAAILLIPFLPVIGLLVLLIRLTSNGPGVFRQIRVGQHGRSYTMFKLRSMSCDAEIKSGPAWTQCNDPRITSLGKWLRKLHLDELPQLINVLRGEMSLIGPRPERPEFVNVLRDSILDYERRLNVLPGITGLSQINLPPDSDLDSVRRKQMLDLQYIQEASFWLDLRILLATSFRMIGIPGDIAFKLACVGRTVELPSLDDTISDANAADTVTLKSIVEQINKGISTGNGNGVDHAVNNYVDGNHKKDKDANELVEAACTPVRRRPK